MYNKIAFEWTGLEELLLVSESRLALKLSGCRAYAVATLAISLKSVQVETLHWSCLCEMCNIFFHDADEAIFFLLCSKPPFNQARVYLVASFVATWCISIF